MLIVNKTMKMIETLAMGEDLDESQSGMAPESPNKNKDEMVESDHTAPDSPKDDNIMTNDSLEEALNAQLADLEEEETAVSENNLSIKTVKTGDSAETLELVKEVEKVTTESETVKRTTESMTANETTESEAMEDATESETVKDTIENETTKDHESEIVKDLENETMRDQESETMKDPDTENNTNPESDLKKEIKCYIKQECDSVTECVAVDKTSLADVVAQDNSEPKNLIVSFKQKNIQQSPATAATNEHSDQKMETTHFPDVEPAKISLEVVAEGDESSNDSSISSKNEMEIDLAAEAKKAVLNFEEGLSDLLKISQSFKTIDEDTSSESKYKTSVTIGVKRPLLEADGQTEDLKQAKKSKQDGEELRKAIKKKLRHLPRKEMENLVAEKMVEMLSSHSEVGKLRRECDAYREMNEKWKRKMAALQKMCQDLNTVMRRYITDVQKEKEKVAPIKITRSVGLQVMTDRRKVVGLPNPVVPQMAAKRTQGSPNQLAQRPVQQANTVQLPSGISVFKPQSASPANRQMAPPAAVPKALPVSINILPAGSRPLPISNGLQTNSTTLNRSLSQDNDIGTKKVITVVDLDDDDDFTPTPPTNQIVIPSSQMRLISTNHLQQQQSQGVTYTVVSSSNTGTTMSGGAMVPNVNRLLIARPQQPGQIVLARNSAGSVNGTAIRQQQFASRPLVIQSQTRPAFASQQVLGLRQLIPLSHPAPLPDVMQTTNNPIWKKVPPKPKLKISRLKTGIVLSWNMDLILNEHATVTMYQIYAYQQSGVPANPNLWKKVGDVKALPLPMACTLTQFTKGNKYHFAIRAQDIHVRVGLFSDPQSIALT